MKAERNAVTLITGASEGIGRELARVCAENRHSLLLISRHEKKLQEVSDFLQKKYNITVDILALDLTEASALTKISKLIEEKNIFIECLINNAGIGFCGKFMDMSQERLHNIFNLNIKALTQLTQLCLPAMITAGNGRIINIASTAGFQPVPTMAVYAASKAYVVSFSHALRHEVKKYGVSVSTVCPGPTRTKFFADSGMENFWLFKSLPWPEPMSVAIYIYRKMMKKKELIIPGFFNRLLTRILKYMPQSWIILMMANLIQYPTRLE